MDAARVTVLRELLAGTAWLERTYDFAGALRGSVSRASAAPDGLLLVGTRGAEPWHLAAHLDDEAAWSGLPQLSPTLVRRLVPPGAPPHLSVPMQRLEQARRGETVFVVAPESADGGLLERVHDARRAGATVLALENGDRELRGLAHEALTVPAEEDTLSAVGFDAVQHLVSSAAGTDPGAGRRRTRRALAGIIARLTAPAPPMRW
ncbi:hypothetical protein ACEZCY_09070 [Streptacidiphilus sp. N1-12]|uniref:SIS domain-containing protein n=2 Tax=Streptacidiphilus alkalitolerans TaxID=3342712 RepID=A0ABV6WUN7_9ACTN